MAGELLQSTHDKGQAVRQVPDDELAYLKSEIVTYLEQAPQAADTVDGIAQWWIHFQRLRTARAKVQAAIDELVAEGRLNRIERADGQVLYAAPPKPPP